MGSGLYLLHLLHQRPDFGHRLLVPEPPVNHGPTEPPHVLRGHTYGSDGASPHRLRDVLPLVPQISWVD